MVSCKQGKDAHDKINTQETGAAENIEDYKIFFLRKDNAELPMVNCKLAIANSQLTIIN